MYCFLYATFLAWHANLSSHHILSHQLCYSWPHILPPHQDLLINTAVPNHCYNSTRTGLKLLIYYAPYLIRVVPPPCSLISQTCSFNSLLHPIVTLIKQPILKIQAGNISNQSKTLLCCAVPSILFDALLCRHTTTSQCSGPHKPPCNFKTPLWVIFWQFNST